MYQQRYLNPQLTGVILKEGVRCGKPGCRCQDGKLHKWYYYHYFRKNENNRWVLCKEYVPRSKVKYLRKRIRLLKDQEDRLKSQIKSNQMVLRKVKSFLSGKSNFDLLAQFAYEIT